MNDVQHLLKLNKLLESAIKSRNLPLAHDLADKRLILLDKIYQANKYSSELIDAVNVILDSEQYLTDMIVYEKNEIKKKLLSIIASDKASQLYKSHAK